MLSRARLFAHRRRAHAHVQNATTASVVRLLKRQISEQRPETSLEELNVVKSARAQVMLHHHHGMVPLKSVKSGNRSQKLSSLKNSSNSSCVRLPGDGRDDRSHG